MIKFTRHRHELTHNGKLLPVPRYRRYSQMRALRLGAFIYWLSWKPKK